MKTALITGASKGIGKATALTLAKEGINCIINYAGDKEGAEQTVSEIKAIGAQAIAIRANIANKEEVRQMIEKVKETFPSIDILVNNAGITEDKTLWNMTSEQWQRVIDVNLNGAYYVTKEVIPLMSGPGRIVSISSIVGIVGNAGQTNYAASKAALIGFTKTLAKELAKKKITVNAVCPGFIETGMVENIPFIRKFIIKKMISLGRVGEPQDIANAVAFLCSEKARYITAETLQVNGGLNF